MPRPAPLLLLAASACAPSPAPPPPSPSLSPSLSPAPPSPSPAAPAPPSPGCGKRPAKTGALPPQRVPIFGKSRSYTLVVPDAYDPARPYPLVFVLHGGGSNAAGARATFDVDKIAHGSAVGVYPDAIGGNWDLDSPAPQNPDVALFDALLAISQSSLCVDLHRVFVTGFSNGAYMANQLGCRRGDRIRAIASHAGGGPYENAGTYDEQGHLVCPGKAVASLVVHGLADGTVPITEGQKSVEHWTFANRCSGGAAPTSPQGCVAYQGCAQPVVACKVQGLGHAVWAPGKQATWAFFDALR